MDPGRRLRFSAKVEPDGAELETHFNSSTASASDAVEIETWRLDRLRGKLQERRRQFLLDLRRPFNLRGFSAPPEYRKCVEEWKTWLEENPGASFDELTSSRYLALCEFNTTWPQVWDHAPSLREAVRFSDTKYHLLWPTVRVSKVDKGFGEIRFAVVSGLGSDFSVKVDPVDTREECNVTAGPPACREWEGHEGMQEVFMAVNFENNGVFMVSPRWRVGGDYYVFEELVFDVFGAPGRGVTAAELMAESRAEKDFKVQSIQRQIERETRAYREVDSSIES